MCFFQDDELVLLVMNPIATAGLNRSTAASAGSVMDMPEGLQHEVQEQVEKRSV